MLACSLRVPGVPERQRSREYDRAGQKGSYSANIFNRFSSSQMLRIHIRSAERWRANAIMKITSYESDIFNRSSISIHIYAILESVRSHVVNILRRNILLYMYRCVYKNLHVQRTHACAFPVSALRLREGAIHGPATVCADYKRGCAIIWIGCVRVCWYMYVRVAI